MKFARIALLGGGLSLLACMASGQGIDPDAASARQKIIELNQMWGKARVAVDKPTFEKTLAPDFYVEIDGQKETRQQFIDEISAPQGRIKMTRFDVDVLTVMKNGDHWDAVIEEKLEASGIAKDGKPRHYYSLWITRDGWKPEGDQWIALYSIAIGHENWRDAKPPVASWNS